jgi:hypothetical protein
MASLMNSRLRPNVSASARMSCEFIERLHPESSCWVLGANLYNDWTWKTFRGLMKRRQAERWVLSHYLTGAEIWLALGEIDDALTREPTESDFRGTRFSAAYSERIETFLACPKKPHAAYQCLSGISVAVWRLEEQVSMDRAYWQAGVFAASCCTESRSALPLARCIPLPPDLYALDFHEGSMGVVAFKAPDYPVMAQHKAIGAPSQTIDGVARRVVVEDRRRADQLIRELGHFKITGTIPEVNPGPVVTTYRFVPSAGIKGRAVEALEDDLARVMASGSVRVSQIKNSSAIGIEIPNKEREIVLLETLLQSPEFKNFGRKLKVILGTDVFGKVLIADLEDAPHFLVAGTTGSGKSVAVNGMIVCLISQLAAADCRLLLIDPKMTEFSTYEGIPHLLAPVVDTKAGAAKALRWLLSETMRRYRLFKSVRGVKQLSAYNAKVEEAERLPYIVAVVDEVADLVTAIGDKSEEGKEDARLSAMIMSTLQKLAAIARAAGVHMILSMQRPSTDIIDGAIKANVPVRIAFQMSSRVDAGVMGVRGAEHCLGKGDGLFMSGSGEITRIHAGYMDPEAICALVDQLCAMGEPEYVDMRLDDEPAAQAEDESDNQDIGQDIGVQRNGKRPLDDILKEALASGGKSRKELSEIAKAGGYASEGSLSASLGRIGAVKEEQGGFQGVTLWMLP